MRPHVPDAQLTASAVPGGDAAWSEVVAFAYSFHAYKIAGSVQRVAAQAVEVHDGWTDDGRLPDGLAPLRLALFHTVRVVDHGAEPDAELLRWVRVLVAAIADRIAAR